MADHHAAIKSDGKQLLLTTSDASIRFHAIWLLDNSSDADTRDPYNGQRLITMQDLPTDVTITDAVVDGDVLHLTFTRGDKTYQFSIDWLLNNGYDTQPHTFQPHLPANAQTWNSGLAKQVPTDDLTRLRNDDAARRNWLFAIRRFGFAKITNLSTKNGSLFDVVALFGYVRGNLVFDYPPNVR